MCWSGEASAVVAVVGIGATIYTVKKGDPKELWLPLLYFTIMEVLQAFTYWYLDACHTPQNQLLTLLSYLHITFQPFFINMIVMHFLPEHIRKKVQGVVYTYCFFATLLFLVKIFPFDWAGQCRLGKETLCARDLCSVSGDWHLAWHFPLNGIPNVESLAYLLPCMIFPFLYGSWRAGLYLLLAGPPISYLLTQNLNEFPAIWCLFSVALVLIAIASPLRKRLYVHSWYGKWKKKK